MKRRYLFAIAALLAGLGATAQAGESYVESQAQRMVGKRSDGRTHDMVPGYHGPGHPGQGHNNYPHGGPWFYYGGHYLPWAWRGDGDVTIIHDGSIRKPWVRSRAAYRKPDRREAGKGRFEEVAVRDVIEGEFIEVFHPAVYRIDEDGELIEVESARTVREPRYRVILTRVWVPAGADGDEDEDHEGAGGGDRPRRGPTDDE